MKIPCLSTAVLPAVLLLAGCAAAPPAVYSLYAPEHAARLGPGAAPHSTRRAQPDLHFEIADIALPERLDRAGIVIHPVALGQAGRAGAAAAGMTGDGAARAGMSLKILEKSRFDAVFGDAFRDALATHLATLAALPPIAQAGGQPQPDMTRLRLRLHIYRFDAYEDGGLDTLIDWHVRRLDDVSDRRHPGMACRFQSRMATGSGQIGQLVGGMQQQLRQLATDIVESSRQWLRDGADRSSCQPGT